MTFKIGILTALGLTYQPTKRLAEAASDRGAKIVAINPYEVEPGYIGNQLVLRSNPVTPEVDVVLPRQGANIQAACLPLIEHYQQSGIRVINGLDSILKARNKYFMLQAMARNGLPVPDTIYATSVEGCLRAREHFNPDPAILKPISGRQGNGVHCLFPDDPIPSDTDTQLLIERGILVQAFIPPKDRLDFRVLVVGKKVAGTMALKAREGDFRTNVHIGGQIKQMEAPVEVTRLAVRATEAMGMEISGADIMLTPQGDPIVIEVNSTPGFKGLEKATGKDIAAIIVDYAMDQKRG